MDKSDYLKDLESTLEYMKIKGYLGDWSNSGKEKFPSQCENPYECTLTFTPPEWLKTEFDLILEKKEIYSIEKKNSTNKINQEEFISIFEKSGLTIDQFAQHLGVTGRYISFIKNGKRKISKKIAQRIREYIEKMNKT